MRLVHALPLFLLACAGGDTDDGTGPDGRDPKSAEITIAILSPAEGDEFPYGEPVPLSVEVERNGEATAADSVTWTVGTWTGRGKETEATGLRAGAVAVEVEVVAGGETLTASVGIVVAEPIVYTYSGPFQADVIAEIDGLGSFDDSCASTIRFTLDAGVVSGSGVCAVFDDFDLDPITFTVEGTATGGNVRGDLVMALDGEEARTPFSGTGTAGAAFTASFDTTHRSSDGSVRIVGTWTANPQ